MAAGAELRVRTWPKQATVAVKTEDAVGLQSTHCHVPETSVWWYVLCDRAHQSAGRIHQHTHTHSLNQPRADSAERVKWMDSAVLLLGWNTNTCSSLWKSLDIHEDGYILVIEPVAFLSCRSSDSNKAFSTSHLLLSRCNWLILDVTGLYWMYHVPVPQQPNEKTLF